MRVSIWQTGTLVLCNVMLHYHTVLCCWLFHCGRQMKYFWGYFLSQEPNTSFSNKGATFFFPFSKQIPHGSQHWVELEQEAECFTRSLKRWLSPPGARLSLPWGCRCWAHAHGRLGAVWVLVLVPGAAANALGLWFATRPQGMTSCLMAWVPWFSSAPFPCSALSVSPLSLLRPAVPRGLRKQACASLVSSCLCEGLCFKMLYQRRLMLGNETVESHISRYLVNRIKTTLMKMAKLISFASCINLRACFFLS